MGGKEPEPVSCCSVCGDSLLTMLRRGSRGKSNVIFGQSLPHAYCFIGPAFIQYKL